MPMPQETLYYPGRDAERRAVSRTTINRAALMYFAGPELVHPCCVRNISDYGAGLRLEGLNIIPSEFGISFDDLCTMRLCRLVWRDGDFVGVVFES
jgi:hypothetical protein